MSTRKKISILTPCFNEQGNVRAAYERIRAIFENELRDYDYEHVFCDNSSTDETVSILKDIAAQDKHIKAIVNARNYGPFRSAFNGLRSLTGDAALIYLAADLQDPPEMLIDFVRKWEEGYKVIYGVRTKRMESGLMTLARRTYYRLVRNLSNIDIPENVGEFQFIDAKVLEALQQSDDYYPYIRGMIANCGFKSIGIEYTWQRRNSGMSKNRFFDLIDQAINGLISFTILPLRLCLLGGFAISVLSLLYSGVQLFVNLFIGRPPVAGIPTLIVALFFFSGLQLFFLGLLGEYIGAIHFQVRKRPLVVELERINFDDGDT